MGAIRFASRRAIPTSANWAVASFCGVSAISFEACQMERKQKIEKMKLIVKATDSSSRGKMIPEDRMIINERGRNNAFNVVIETPREVQEQIEAAQQSSKKDSGSSSQEE